jgi:hypothetical protein
MGTPTPIELLKEIEAEWSRMLPVALERIRKVIEAASAGAEERDCVRCGCTVQPERAFVLCVDCKPLAEIFECEGCGAGRDLRDLNDDGYCATCVAAPSESAPAEEPNVAFGRSLPNSSATRAQRAAPADPQPEARCEAPVHDGAGGVMPCCNALPCADHAQPEAPSVPMEKK